MKVPTDSQHLSIIGANGSGKTQGAIWHLSIRDYVNMPWLVVNFKRDELVDGIPRAVHIDLDEIPVKPGIYITHPQPDELPAVNDQLYEIWKRGRCGVYIDEGYIMGNRNADFRRILTQGRSLQIPLIVLSQRPTWMDPFVFSESQFFQLFRLQRQKDIQNVQDFIHGDVSKRLPEYYSYYYDVKGNDLKVLSPVPLIDEIYKTFERRLPPPKDVF